MILASTLAALWAALVAVGFIFGATFPNGSGPRFMEFLAPLHVFMPNFPGPGIWVGRLVQPFASIALALLIAAASRGAGRAASMLPGTPKSSGWWMTYAIGGGLLSFLVFGLGLAGLLYQPILFVLFGLFCLGGARGISVPQFTGSGLPVWLVASSILTLAVWLLGVLVPEPGIDAYLYHLRLPFYYLLHHRIYSVWHQIHGHVPQMWELLLTVFPREYLVTGAQALSALTALAVWRMAVARGNGGWGFKAGLLLVMSSPLVVGIGTSAYTDLPLMWLEFGAFILLVPLSGMPSKSARFWAGAVLGLATSLKYASFPAFAAASVLLLIQSIRLRSPGYVLPSITGFLAVFWPWLAWNGLATGNPVFPFLGRYFPDALASLPFADRLAGAVFKRSAWNIFQSPWNALVRCEPYLFLVPLLIITAPLIIISRLKRSVPAMTGIWSASFIIAWAIFMADERFILGVIPVLLLMMPRLDEYRAGKPIFALFLLLNIAGFFRQQLVPFSRFWAATGVISRQDYLDRNIGPSPGYRDMTMWINDNTCEMDRILFVSDFKSPYIWRECIHDHVYDYPTRLVYLLWNTPMNPDRIAVRFRQMGIRWVVYLPTVNMARLGQMPDLFPFVPETSKAWGGFWNKYAVPRAVFPSVFVYGISPHPLTPRLLYHLPGVQDAAMITVDDLAKTQGPRAVIDYLRRLSRAYPLVGEFHASLGLALLANPETEREGREQLRIASKAIEP